MNAMKSSWGAAGLTAALIATQGCSTMLGKTPNNERILSVNSSIPAAEGKVEFGITKDANTSIDLQVSHLAEPEKLTPASNTYVVWAMARNEAPQNIGELTLDNNLEGAFHNEVPLLGFELFLTAEPSAIVQRPTGPRLLWAVY